MKPLSRELCLICKGARLLCGESFCPLLQKIRIQQPRKEKLSDLVYGKSPSVFVGHHSYPNVYVGPMTSLDDELAGLLDNPKKWYGSSLNDIVEMRSLLLRSKKRHMVKDKNPFTEEVQEIALASKPVYVENKFKKTPSYNLSFSSVNQPMGPSGMLERLSLAENPKIPKKVDRIVSDELGAGESLVDLYSRKFDVYYLTKIFSSGALGSMDDRRLVPTRWSITAVDDIISKEQMKEIKTYPLINDIMLYSNTYLDNHFQILMIPGSWEFEQFEAWAPRTLWTLSASKPAIIQENEPFTGRTTYAEKQGGGYYASRFAVTEFLHLIGRQARVIVFREISEGYVVPVGVWEVRENVRAALGKKPVCFKTLDGALKHLAGRLRLPVKDYIKRSEALRQKRITDFI
ncbi:MAG: Nre family DNA repair protein [Candidatus Altiarchaeota archaeon]|nr:Nre family DNA repair protein [Candidatus Altiarchaeota archaeon]